jgi:hypothetical protein
MNKKIQITLIILSITAIILGIIRGELSDIFRKATMICLECIGIG